MAKVAKRLSVLYSGGGVDSRLGVKLALIKGQGLSWLPTHVGLETATTTIPAAILGQLLYVLLLRCGFLESDFWKGTPPVQTDMDDPHSLAHEVPDRLLHKSVEIGLKYHEVIARRIAYGTNELRPPRSWISVLMRLLFGPANLLLEVKYYAGPRYVVTTECGRLLFYSQFCAMIGGTLLLVCGFLALNIRGAVQKIWQYDEIAESLAWDPSKLATTLREGKISKTTVRELVPGDVVRVSEVSCVSHSTSQSRNLTTATGLRDTRRGSRSQNGQYPLHRSIKHHG